jgi:hypothetical protein
VWLLKAVSKQESEIVHEFDLMDAFSTDIIVTTSRQSVFLGSRSVQFLARRAS